MASTKPEADYVHRLLDMYMNKYKVNVKFSAINIAFFERGFVDAPFDKTVLESLDVKNPDIVVFQIGENVSKQNITANGELFLNLYCEIINLFPDSQRIVCLPFWPDKDKINVITAVALRTDSRICDLSHLGSGIDPDNFASSYRKYSNPGVGAHPGDVGMRRIAECILAALSD